MDNTHIFYGVSVMCQCCGEHTTFALDENPETMVEAEAKIETMDPIEVECQDCGGLDWSLPEPMPCSAGFGFGVSSSF